VERKDKTSRNSQKPNIQTRSDAHYNQDYRSRLISAALERKWFKFERRTVIDELESLRLAVTKGAIELEMVADERTFSVAISEKLKEKSRILQKLASDLNQLEGDIAHTTGYPKNEQK
jgi:hypothetical protein